MTCTPIYDTIQRLWYRYRKIERYNFGRKRKPTGFIYLPVSRFCEAEGQSTIRSCLQEDFMNSSCRIGKYIKKLELYRQCPPRSVKDTKYLR